VFAFAVDDNFSAIFCEVHPHPAASVRIFLPEFTRHALRFGGVTICWFDSQYLSPSWQIICGSEIPKRTQKCSVQEKKVLLAVCNRVLNDMKICLCHSKYWWTLGID